jgi:hypothetical protein
MTAARDDAACTGAVVRKPPMKETALRERVAVPRAFKPREAGPCAPATRSSVTGRCGACHRARIRATRWHRRENAAPRPGHERICSPCRLVICPTGKSVNWLSSPLCKNISLHPSGKSSLQIRAIPPHKRGVGHRHERGVGCGGRGSVLRATGLQGGR